VRDEHELLLPAHMPKGEYELRVGMYILETMERLMVVDSEQEVEGEMILLGMVRVSGHHGGMKTVPSQVVRTPGWPTRKVPAQSPRINVPRNPAERQVCFSSSRAMKAKGPYRGCRRTLKLGEWGPRAVVWRISFRNM